MKVSPRIYMATVASSILTMALAALYGSFTVIAIALVIYVASVLILTPAP
jgi:hypothetical protein